MMTNRRQQDRMLSLSTPLGNDVLTATGFESVEGLSQCFEFRIKAESDQDTIDFSGALGQNCAVTLKAFSDNRVFNGVLVEAQWTGGVAEDRSYTLVLRPWLWLLTRTRNYKIFANKNVPDIIADVFRNLGFTDFSQQLSESYPVLEYCVQYGESDFAFVSRLMERFGIHYFFTHSEGAHTLVMTDSGSGHSDLGLTLPYRPGRNSAVINADYLNAFTSERRLCTGKVTMSDYDFLAPDGDLKTDKASSESYSHAQLEGYEYPGKYPRTSPTATKKQNDGSHLVKVQLDAHQALDHRRYAEGDALPLFPGSTFTLSDHTDAGKYLVVEARHTVEEQAYESGAAASGSEPSASSFVLQPADRPFQALPITPRPVVHGPQTARVVGASGEEIDVDEHGRVLLHFFWDRDSVNSRRVRVAQLWAAANWGAQFIPRVDQEVVVEFLDGDPDRPLIVGAVYNAKMTPPYSLPANKTKSGIKSNSSKGGGGYNEFVFQDEKGQECIGMHAQRDHQVVVLNSETKTVGEQFKTPRGSPSSATTLKNGDDTLKVEKGDRTVTIDQGDHKTTISQGNHETTVSLGDQKIDVSVGNQTTTVMQKIAMTANLEIKLTVGGSSITIDQTGVTIKGPMITVEADAMTQVKAPIVQVNADAMLMLKGGITMIN